MVLRDYPEKMNSYEAYWLRLPRDMENMGYFFEYCAEYVRQVTGKDIVLDQVGFCDAFMRSKCRREMEMGHPQLASQAAVDTVRCFIEVDLNGDISRFMGQEMEYKPMQMYWIGWMYAYLHYKADIHSRDLVRKMSVQEMLVEYEWGHQLSEEGFYQRVRYMFVGDSKCGYVD